VEMIRSVWSYRSLIRGLVLQEFRDRSARSLWGYAWVVIEPAVQIAIYVVIFSSVLQAKLPGTGDRLSYSIYPCSGLLAWNFFAGLLLQGRTLFVEHADLLRTMRFPRSTLAIALLGRNTINAAIPIVMFLILLVAMGRWPGPIILAAVPFLLIQTILGLGLAVLVGTLNVFIRDVGAFVGVVAQFWFWLTPIVYPIGVVPEAARGLLEWNPMLHVVDAYQRVLVGAAAPDWSTLVPLSILTLVVVGGALMIFRALAPDLVDEL
jgi:lipopolysaccharide transport system permease protein